MQGMTIEEQIKDFVLSKARMDKVGIASIDRFNSAPEGYHPTDFLPGCKSVIAFITGIPDGSVDAQFRVFEDGQHEVHGIYGAFGYVGAPNYNLMWANYKVARFIEKITGEMAMPNPAGPTQGMKMMSMRHCAYAAGLGEFGWNSLLLTPEFGTRNRLGAVLTTAELKPDPLYDGPKLCDPQKCHVCVDVCPTGAIPPFNPDQARKICIGGKEQCYSGLNWTKCKLMCHGTWAEFNESGKDIVPRTITDPINEDIGKYILGFYAKHPRNEFPQHNPTWKCGNCMAYCPVGNWKGRYQRTGLSNRDIDMFIDKEN